MSSEWWDEGFNQQYSVIKNFCLMITSLALTIRVIVAISVSFEAAFGNSQLYIMTVVVLGISVLAFLEKAPITLKKVYFFILMQFFSINNRFLSIKVAPNAEVPLCIHSTVLLLFFESYVFRNSVSMIFLMIKHIFLWVLIDFENFSLKKDFNGKEAIVGMTSLISILLAFYFESYKRENLRSKHESTEKCQAAHDQLLQILKAFPDGLVIFDSDFIIKFQNDSISTFLSEEKCSLSEKLYLFKVSQNQVSVLELVKDFLNNKSQTYASFGVSTIESSKFEWRGHKITWDDQICIMLSLRDVTKILEFERVSAEINSKNLIIRSISHEFRTPINCINMIIDDFYTDLQQDIKEKVNLIKTCTQLLLYQLNDILDYSDLTSNRFFRYDSEVNLNQELEKCLELIKFQASYKGIQVKSDLDEALSSKILTDEYRVKKIVVNLLTNALKYTSKGTIKLFSILKGNRVLIGVKDTGVGIPSERLKYINTMFRGDNESSLSGLGLHVCQKILEQLNSSLSIYSIIGKGSIFSFDLPLIQKSGKSFTIEEPQVPEAQEAQEVPTESESRSRIRKMSIRFFDNENPRLMIVDDHEFNRMCLRNIFKSEGIQCIEAFDGKDAVDKVILNDQMRLPFKVIIMDLNMPVMDGWESCRIIKQLYSQGKISFFPMIIGYTAFTDERDVNRCYEAGMIHFLPKPSPREEILMIVKKFL